MKTEYSVSGGKLPCSVYVNSKEWDNLKAMRRKVEQDWDMIGLIVGKEGSGKSMYAFQRALVLDSDFCLDRVVFNTKQFYNAVDNANPYDVIVWDEADTLGGHWASRIIQSLKRKFKRIRKNNLIILLVTPSFFDLNKYFTIHRLNFLVHVYAKGKGARLERGHFRLFGGYKLKHLYINGKKYWNMWAPTFPVGYNRRNSKRSFRKSMCDLYGRFTKLPSGFPIDMDLYEEKKDESTAEIKAENEGEMKKVAVKNAKIRCVGGMYELFMEDVDKASDVTHKMIGEKLGWRRDTISRYLIAWRKMKESGELDNFLT